MIDRLFSALLTFAVLAGATFAIAAAWFEPPSATAQLPRVEVTGKRVVPVQIVASCEPGSAALAPAAPRC